MIFRDLCMYIVYILCVPEVFVECMCDWCVFECDYLCV